MNKKKVRITNTGYLPNSPDRHNAMNIIPSNRITMDRVPFPIMAIDNLGNSQMMMPGMNYRFPGQYVTEIPMGSYNPRKRYNDLRQKQNNLEQLRDNYLRKNIQNYDPTNFVKYNTPYEGTGLSLNESNELERLSTLGYLTPEEKSRSFGFKQGGKIAKYQGDKEPSQVKKDKETLPTLNVEADRPGYWDRFVNSSYNPFNWGLPDYSKLSNPTDALYQAAYYGEPEFMWRGRRTKTAERFDMLPIEDRLANTGKTNFSDTPIFKNDPNDPELYISKYDSYNNEYTDVPVENVKQYQKAYTDALQYTKDWMSSPMYNKMLKNSTSPALDEKGRDRYELYKKNREKNIKDEDPEVNIVNKSIDTNMPDDIPAAAWSGPKGISIVNNKRDLASEQNRKTRDYLNRFYVKDPEEKNLIFFIKNQQAQENTKQWLNSLLTHEFSHETDKSKGNFRWIPQADEDYMLNHQMNKKQSDAYYKDPFKTNPWYFSNNEKWKDFYINYVGQPTETRARLQEIRRYAKDKGIYDPFIQELDQKTFERLLNEYNEVPGLNSLIPIYKPEEIRYMLNNISENKSNKNNIMTNDIQQAKQGGMYLGNYEFKNGGLVKMQGDDSPSQVSPKGKGWREYKTPTGESLYLDPRFKDQRYYVNEKGDHITPDPNMSLYDVTDNIWESGTSLPPLEITSTNESQKNKWLDDIYTTINPKNWGVADYSSKDNFDSAFATAREAGEKEFIWNNQRFTTDKIGEKRPESSFNLSKKQREKIYNSVNPMGYPLIEIVPALRRYISNVKRQDTSLDNPVFIPRLNKLYNEVEKELREGKYKPDEDAWAFYMGLDQKNNSVTESKYRPTNASNPNTVYYTIKTGYNNNEFSSDVLGRANYHFSQNPDSTTLKGKRSGLTPLENVTYSKGKDERGDYYSIYDIYDFSIPLDEEYNGGRLNRLLNLVGKPYEIYDRVYYRTYKNGVLKPMYYSDEELSKLDVNKKNFDTLALQKELVNKGYELPKSTKEDYSLDGVWGEETKKALLDYQSKNKKQTGGQMGGDTNIQNGIYLGKYMFKNGGLVKYQDKGQVDPKSKGWREYKTPTGQSLYLDPRFNNQRYYVDEKGNTLTPDQNMSLFDVQDNIWESGTSMAPLEVSPRYTYRQVPGALGAMETIRVDADNGTEQIVSPDVMKTNREGQSFINTMSPFGGGLLVEGVGNIAQGNIGQGLIETALSIPIVGQTIGKVVTAPLKFAGREVASTYGPLLSHTGEYLGNQFDRGLTFLEKNQGAFGISPKVKNIPSSKTLTSAEMSRLAEMDRGMAIQSEPLNRYQKVQKIINHINSSNNLSDDDIKTMFGSTREELFKELEAGAKTLGPPPGAVPREASNINLSRPARNRTSEQIAADNARRATRSTNSAVQNLNQTLANNNYNIDDAQALLESIPAYERQGLNLTTDTEGLPVIELDVSSVVDRDVIANLADKVVKPTRIKRTKDAIKDLFSSNPVYKGDVKKLTPDLHAYSFKSPRHMLLDVKSKLDKGLKDLNIGEVATGSTDTSHNSYLNQMDFIAQNAGKEGLSQPIFLGYQPMNPAGYLSNAQVPQEEIFKYINTKLNELQRRRNFNFNLGENPPFMEGDKIMIPQYGVKKVSDSFKGIKKQEGGSKEMPFGLPLKEQNIYLLPEYNQPINPKTGEILPDMRRPNLGMNTGATEYKYTYGTDKGDIDIPSIVAGQYIGDQALNRYNLTGERFKIMNDPGSYSKFYDEMNKLGLMQERNGGAIKKVKIKSLPRKNK